MSLKLISGKAVADKAYDQYSSLKGEMEVANIDFSMKIGRLDDFYFKKMKVSKFLTLSHGQADVERGFSVNNDVLQDNIQEDLIISKRLVKDFLNSNAYTLTQWRSPARCKHHVALLVRDTSST